MLQSINIKPAPNWEPVNYNTICVLRFELSVGTVSVAFPARAIRL